MLGGYGLLVGWRWRAIAPVDVADVGSALAAGHARLVNRFWETGSDGSRSLELRRVLARPRLRVGGNQKGRRGYGQQSVAWFTFWRALVFVSALYRVDVSGGFVCWSGEIGEGMLRVRQDVIMVILRH